MSSKGMSLKGRINHYAKQNGIAAQVVLQNYMFERFLDRLSRSEYRQKFVIKGGMLVTAIVGIETRATMILLNIKGVVLLCTLNNSVQHTGFKRYLPCHALLHATKRKERMYRSLGIF